ncbi:hypothetical protein CH253_08340 [Rhodococcus sp. 06-156-3C]|uniref:hypothetical protein n=1 Tax=Rhodococcus sp. 06-156-3C TaxID=2022486 RepID=UPI000B9C736D|nr:hypothetical protein [Rhodococcus sp. 06-156-3C]OZD23855.1 hypothetical protein CH253_08340 [Rhodococcus sp. 06-156-3C]
MSLEAGQLEQIERDNDNAGISYRDGLALVAYVRQLQERNENLSQQYRVAENTAVAYAAPLGKIRELVARHRAGLLEPKQFVAGVNYWADEGN